MSSAAFSLSGEVAFRYGAVRTQGFDERAGALPGTERQVSLHVYVRAVQQWCIRSRVLLIGISSIGMDYLHALCTTLLSVVGCGVWPEGKWSRSSVSKVSAG